MSEEDGKQLVRDAIRAGIFNDMGSGSNVDLVVIKAKDDVRLSVTEIFRNGENARYNICEDLMRLMSRE